jgi:hypothetical protein
MAISAFLSFQFASRQEFGYKAQIDRQSDNTANNTRRLEPQGDDDTYQLLSLERFYFICQNEAGGTHFG